MRTAGWAIRTWGDVGKADARCKHSTVHSVDPLCVLCVWYFALSVCCGLLWPSAAVVRVRVLHCLVGVSVAPAGGASPFCALTVLHICTDGGSLRVDLEKADARHIGCASNSGRYPLSWSRQKLSKSFVDLPPAPRQFGLSAQLLWLVLHAHDGHAPPPPICEWIFLSGEKSIDAAPCQESRRASEHPPPAHLFKTNHPVSRINR